MSAYEPSGNPLVLLVDDSPVDRFMAREALEQAECRVIEADDGVAGVGMFKAHRVDLVLLDVKMPRLDGFGACAAIRKLAQGEHTPILMLTGLDDHDSINRAYEEGATDFFTKPLNTTMLQHRMRYLLRAKLTADALRSSQEQLAHAQRIAKLGYWEWRRDSGLVTWSPEVECMIGAPSKSSSGILEALCEHVHEEDVPELEQSLRRMLNSGEAAALEYRLIVADGRELTVHHTLDPTVDSSGQVEKLVGAVQDVTDRCNAEQRIRRLAYYDSVTELPNRTLFSDMLCNVLAQAKRHGRIVSVLFLDLDHFKRVNDTFGHSAGDQLLQEIAFRLGECVRDCDFLARPTGKGRGEDMAPDERTVARLGGDEFVVLLPEVRDPANAANVAERMRGALEHPVLLDGREIYMTGSIGISSYPIDGDDVETLLKHADAAMYQAKAEGRNRYQFYTASINARALERMSIETNMRKALEAGEFVLHYQPIVAVDSQEVCAAEALVRWDAPNLGLISPASFIPIAEETGLIIPLGKWAIRQACKQAQEWQRDEVFEGRISVNLSVAQFQHAELVADIAAALDETGLDPRRLQLELTESMVMQDSSSSIQLLMELKALDVSIAIDDFGTGYSSLSYLKRFPIDVLKIDQSFIRDIGADRDDAAIVSATVMLGDMLRMQTVAEGVEQAEQLEFLRGLGCDECQGYYFCRPLPAREFASWMRNWTALPSKAAAAALG